MSSLTDGLLCDDLNNPSLIAVVEEAGLVDLWAAGQDNEALGSVHLARVTARHPRHHRLSGQLASGTVVSWPMRANDKCKAGQLVPVTITAVSRPDKPVQAVAGIELAGRYTVLRWRGREQGQVQLSRRAGPVSPDDDHTDKLAQIGKVTGALSKGFDLIFRRSVFRKNQSFSANFADIIRAEIEGLLAAWDEKADMPDDLRTQTSPRAVYGGASLGLMVNRLYPDLGLRQLGPADWPAIQSAYDEARQTRYETRDGAVLWFEQTRAAVMVDIDSAGGKLGPDRLCSNVLPDLFRQIRLRRLAGKIVVDMPYLTKKSQTALLTEIDQQASCDPRYPDCLGFTRSGLLELSVRHSRPVIDADLALQTLMERLARRYV